MTTSKPNMRTEWFAHVSRVRAKMTKAAKRPVSHQTAMSEASKTWAVEKAKIEKKHARQSKREAKALAKKLDS